MKKWSDKIIFGPKSRINTNNRIVLASLTRMRSDVNGIPNDLMT